MSLLSLSMPVVTRRGDSAEENRGLEIVTTKKKDCLSFSVLDFLLDFPRGLILLVCYHLLYSVMLYFHGSY